MKLIFRTIGQFLLAGIVAAMILTLISSLFIPAVRDFVGQVFPKETNFIVDQSTENTPTLTATETVVSIPASAYASYDPLDGITALSSDGDNLISQLEQDLEKPKEERTHIFIYSLTDSGQVLCDEIDRTSSGNWKIFYIVSDENDNFARLTVTVEVYD